MTRAFVCSLFVAVLLGFTAGVGAPKVLSVAADLSKAAVARFEPVSSAVASTPSEATPWHAQR